MSDEFTHNREGTGQIDRRMRCEQALFLKREEAGR